jgi:hypothetical protein
MRTPFFPICGVGGGGKASTHPSAQCGRGGLRKLFPYPIYINTSPIVDTTQKKTSLSYLSTYFSRRRYNILTTTYLHSVITGKILSYLSTLIVRCTNTVRFNIYAGRRLVDGAVIAYSVRLAYGVRIEVVLFR